MWLGGKTSTRVFEASIKVTAANKQGVLARVAAEIAKAESNIDDIAMENEGDYMQMHFILQVNNRHHLAQIMRGLRHLEEIAKISRVKG
jgi:guanosine-3',5'-bis(diphosphate) 3'-pyrophosphohydrolase